jgi:hypothetical protein
MAREPSYPDDAPVGKPADKAPPAEATGSDSDDKILDDKDGDSRRTRHIVTGAAIGIGSAALVAALLYANRSRKGGNDEGK